MPPAPIFARVQPKSIKVSEKYFYTADPVNQFMRVKQEEEKAKAAEGSLEISIPYDGVKHVTQQTLEDIARQSSRIWQQPAAAVRVGYLAFVNYGRSDLETLPDFPIAHDALALDLPIQGPDLPSIQHKRQAAALLQDRHRWQMKQTYAPKMPPSPPVTLSVQSYDEAQLDQFDRRLTRFFEKLDALRRDGKSKAPTPKEMLRLISSLTQQEDLQHRLTFEFEVTLRLPTNIAKEENNNLPKLERIAIQWPVTVAAEQVHLDIDEKKQATAENQTPQARYVPVPDKPGEIEWRGVVLQLPSGDPPEKGPYTYTTPPMRLHVTRPAELYQTASLQGTLEIKIPKLALSGLQVQFFDATGKKSEPQAEIQSQLNVDFEISLADYATSKTVAPYQHLQFEGVVLDANRIIDIQTVLAEFGLMSRAERLVDLGGYTDYYIIRGTQAVGLGQITLWILCEGLPALTHRATVIPGGQSYSSSLRVGHTKLYVRGQTAGEKTALLEKMNQVQEKLKTIFQYVKTVD